MIMIFEKIQKYRALLEDKTELGGFATFVPNKKLPVYNWIYFKEGFSRDLVFLASKMFGLQDGIVLDPFCGVGTTLVACREKGIESIGFDVLPLSVFASRAKTRNYDAEELKNAARKLLADRFEKTRMEFLPVMKKAFSKYALEDIAFFMERIQDAGKEDVKNFLLLALMNAAMKVSYSWKDGSVIKFRKSHKPPLRFMLKRTAKRMINDVEKMKASSASCLVEQCDARRLKLEDERVDAVITSPPYLNQIDYTRVYEIENWFISGLHSKPPLRSYIGLDGDTEFFPELQLPAAANAYFKDMNMALQEMFRVCKQGAKAAIVVGNAYFPDRIVDSDLILSCLAEQTGFAAERILVLNKRFALEERTKKKGILRESMIVLRK